MPDFSNLLRDYNYYDRWTFLFPMYSLIATFAVSIITIVLAFLLRKALGKNLRESYDQLNKKQICLKLFLGGLRNVMLRTSNFLLFEFEYEKNQEEDNKARNQHKYEYRLYGVSVHLFVLQYLFIMLLSVLAASFLSFWNVFFAESEVDACNELLDCFPMYRNNSTPIDINPITDCTQHTINKDTTIICFQVVFKYSEGLGEAGGFLFSMQVILNIVIYVVMSVFKTMLKVTKIASHRNRNVSRNVSRARTLTEIGRRFHCHMPRFIKGITITITLLIYLIIVILLPIIVLQEREDFLYTIKTKQRQLELALYGFTVFELFLVPLIVGSGVYARRTYNQIKISNQETELQPIQNTVHVQNKTVEEPREVVVEE